MSSGYGGPQHAGKAVGRVNVNTRFFVGAVAQDYSLRGREIYVNSTTVLARLIPFPLGPS